MMKKLILITLAATAAFALLGAFIPSEGTAGTAMPAAVYSDSGEAYLVTGQDGMVAVMRGDELYLRTDTPVASLPKADRVKLDRGITVYSKEELKTLLEDLCS